MAQQHSPPAGIADFDHGNDPAGLYEGWHRWIAQQVQPDTSFPNWYASLNPPNTQKPAEAAPPWSGLPRMALLLNKNDVLAAAQAVDAPVAFGAGRPDPLTVEQPPFLNSSNKPVAGFSYRPQDEYLEWVTKKDGDGVVREIWFTCEGPEYWQFIGDNDQNLLLRLYGEILEVSPQSLDPKILYFQETLTHVEPFANGAKLTFEAGSYNPYNSYNIANAVHLTQGANSLGAEIALAMNGSLVWGNPPKTTNPDLICCALFGEPNRFSDPTIGKEVNDLVRKNMFVTLRNPIGLYIQNLIPANFTDEDGNPIPDLGRYFQPIRTSPDGQLILRAIFKVPTGVKNKQGKQARVGDLRFLGKPITTGGQVASAVTMHLFAQALSGGGAQKSQNCRAHPCPDPNFPGLIIPTPIGTPCKGASGKPLVAHIQEVEVSFKKQTQPPPSKFKHTRAISWGARGG